MFSSTGTVGIIILLILIAAVVIGCFFFYSSTGDSIREYLKESFSSSPPPPKIDPHTRIQPRTALLDDEVLVERDAYVPPTGPQYIPPDPRCCPKCGAAVYDASDGDPKGYIKHYFEKHIKPLRPYERDQKPWLYCSHCRLNSQFHEEYDYGRPYDTNPYCTHCGGTGVEPIEFTIENGKEIVRRLKVIISDDDLLICPECRNNDVLRLKCTLCEQNGVLTRRKIRELGYLAPRP